MDVGQTDICTWSAENILRRIKDINRKFRIVASQVLFVDNQIKDTEVRFYRTQNESKRRMSFFYMLRLRLCTLENIRNRFYDYAVLQADELESLQLEFMELTGLHEWDDDLMQDADLAHHTVDIDLMKTLKMTKFSIEFLQHYTTWPFSGPYTSSKRK